MVANAVGIGWSFGFFFKDFFGYKKKTTPKKFQIDYKTFFSATI